MNNGKVKKRRKWGNRAALSEVSNNWSNLFYSMHNIKRLEPTKQEMYVKIHLNLWKSVVNCKAMKALFIVKKGNSPDYSAFIVG